MRIEKQNPGFAKRVKSWLTGKYVENGSTASQNIPAGKWVTWKGQVCYSKTAITAGDTLSSTNLGTDEEGTLNGLLKYKDIHITTSLSFTTSSSTYIVNKTYEELGIPNTATVVSATLYTPSNGGWIYAAFGGAVDQGNKKLIVQGKGLMGYETTNDFWIRVWYINE